MAEFQFHVAMTLDREQTLEFIKVERKQLAAVYPELKGMGEFHVKSQWLCDLLNEREKVDGYQYNTQFQRWFEKEFNVGPYAENGSTISILVYNAQGYRRHDQLIAEGFQPGTDELLRQAFEQKKPIELKVDHLFTFVVNGEKQENPSVERLKVREIEGKLYAMRPKKRKYAVSIDGRPVRLAS